MNKVMLLGNVGSDPEFKAVGTGLLKFRLATTEKYKSKEGDLKESTEWHSITMWGPRTEGLSKIIKKGERLFIEGSIRTSSYEKNGEKRYRTEIVANDVQLSGRLSAGTLSDDEIPF